MLVTDILKDKNIDILVVGAGVTGVATIKFLLNYGYRVSVFDHNVAHKNKHMLQNTACIMHFGTIAEHDLQQVDLIVLSPGVCPYSEPWSLYADKITSDISIFCNFASKPIIAVTGSNGKSTVTSMLQTSLQQLGYCSVAGGNLGCPSLDLLAVEQVDYYILELSSYQLALTSNLAAKIAIFLNISPDHLAWHGGYREYLLAKKRIFNSCENAVVFKDQEEIYADIASHIPVKMFSAEEPVNTDEFGCSRVAQQVFLSQGKRHLINTESLNLLHSFQWLNYLAVYATLQCLAIKATDYLPAVNKFDGLAHRCENVGEIAARYWYNDSKATNSAAMLAAICSMSAKYKRFALLAGGVFKEEQLPLLPCDAVAKIKVIVLFGQDAAKFYDNWSKVCSCIIVADLAAAIDYAYGETSAGDAILLAPGCASFDQFENFEYRGDFFKKYVISKFIKN